VLAACSDAVPDSANAPTVEPEAIESEAGDLLVVLGAVTDPRKSRGVRHRMITVLAAAVCAVLAGARSYAVIAEWAHDLPVSVRLRLGMGRRVPSESTFRRVLQRVDADELDTAVSGWLARRVTGPTSAGATSTGATSTGATSAGATSAGATSAGATSAGATSAGATSAGATSTGATSAGPTSTGATRTGPVRAIAVDGKTARGARRADGPAVHLLGALDHRSGVVLGQTEVDHKTNEITAFIPLLERIDSACSLAGAVITADALHTQHAHARWLRSRGAHYVFIVKGNQPTLRTQLAELPWPTVPVVDDIRGRGHGRAETRTLQLAAIAAGIGFPDAQLAIRITRRRRHASTKRCSTETVYAVTSLGFADVRAGRLAEILRGHWHIENRLHWVRDVTFAEDLSQIRTGTGPAVMAVLRNLAISRHRLAGATNIASACRDTARHPRRATDLLT
jgi:predicted transposase YbfD/YdcC